MDLDTAGLRRARARALLLSGSGSRDLGVVVRTVVGVQAQDRAAAALAIRVRGCRSTAREVAAACGEGGPLVLTWSLRGTRHLHHVEDVRWLLAVAGPSFAAGSPARERQLGIAGDAGDRAVGAVRDAVRRRGPLTRPQVKEVLARRGVDASGQAPIHVLRRAALQGVLCVVPTEEGQETYVPLDGRAPPRPPVAREAALGELARRFLHGYGPAAPEDLAAWSGLPRRAAADAWAAIGDELTEVAVPGGAAWILTTDVRPLRAAARRPVPVRLLPAFDPLLLGYADRETLVPRIHARRVNAGGGMIRPTVLTDEGIVGTWSPRRDGGDARIEVTPFGALPAATRAAIEGEAERASRMQGRPSPAGRPRHS